VTHIWGPAASEEEEEGALDSASFLLTVIIMLSHLLPPLKNGGKLKDCLFLSVVLLIINIGSVEEALQLHSRLFSLSTT